MRRLSGILSGEVLPKTEAVGDDGPNPNIMYYVYLIKSVNFTAEFYVGYTVNLVQRLETHNSGGSIHTAKYKPWELVMYLGVSAK
jgi:putative endonuclease